MIRELKLILRGYLGAAELDRLTTIHPASSYDRDYFPDLRGATAASGLVSFDRHAHHGARMAALRADLATACGGMALPAEGLLESLAPQVRSGLAPALRIIEMPPLPPAPNRRRRIPAKSRFHWARLEGIWNVRCRAPRATRWG